MIEWDQEKFEHEILHEIERVSAQPGGAVKGTNGTGKSPLALALTFFDQLTEPAPKPWLFKNVIAKDETSSWIAPPGKGKSALLTDIAIHNASGRDWRGYRTRGAGGVVYFALERADLVNRRLAAYRRRDGLLDLPIAVAHQVNRPNEPLMRRHHLSHDQESRATFRSWRGSRHFRHV
jgi:hypothetical protein